MLYHIFIPFTNSPSVPFHLHNRAKVPADYVTARSCKILQHVYYMPDGSTPDSAQRKFFYVFQLSNDSFQPNPAKMSENYHEIVLRGSQHGRISGLTRPRIFESTEYRSGRLKKNCLIK